MITLWVSKDARWIIGEDDEGSLFVEGETADGTPVMECPMFVRGSLIWENPEPVPEYIRVHALNICVIRGNGWLLPIDEQEVL